jgi:hypothetical protein
MKTNPWLRALIIILVPVTLGLIDKVVIKSGYSSMLYEVSLILLLLWNLLLYVKTDLLKLFFITGTFILLEGGIEMFVWHSDKGMLQLFFDALVPALLFGTAIRFPNKTQSHQRVAK